MARYFVTTSINVYITLRLTSAFLMAKLHVDIESEFTCKHSWST